MNRYRRGHRYERRKGKLECLYDDKISHLGLTLAACMGGVLAAYEPNAPTTVGQPGLAFTAVQTGRGASNTRPEEEQKLARAIYKEFIEIQSGYTTGATTPVAQAAATRLRAAGFPDADIFVGGAHPNKANLVVRYRGTGARKPILLLAHTDVVEAKREDWTTNPFEFVEKDGFFYGRGTGDDKAQAAAWIANLIQYKREGFKPDRDIIVALTADEEGGGPYNGVAWLLKEHRDLIDAELALNEGGWGEEAGGKKLSNDVQVSEKYVVNYRLEVHNKGGHSSMPVPDNAIYHLAAALDRLSKFGFPLKTNEVTATYFKKMASIERGAIKGDLARVADGSRDAMQRVAAASPAWNATLRTTCVATQLEGGHAVNALPQLAAATVNCRVLPEDTEQYGARHAEESRGGRSGRFQPDGGAHQGSGIGNAARCDGGGEQRDRHILAGRAGGADHGHGRHRWRLPSRRRNSDVRCSGILHGSRRHPFSWPRRAPGCSSVLRRAGVPLRSRQAPGLVGIDDLSARALIATVAASP